MVPELRDITVIMNFGDLYADILSNSLVFCPEKITSTKLLYKGTSIYNKKEVYLLKTAWSDRMKKLICIEL